MNTLDETLGALSRAHDTMHWLRHQLGELPSGTRAVAAVLLDRINEDLASLQEMLGQHRDGRAQAPREGKNTSS